MVNRLMFTGTKSGSGKTTITCGILKAIMDRGKKVSSFKCGPDYIDPMFHKEIIGVPSSNLDLFLTDENTVKYLLYENGKSSHISIIEGVMGMYDGLGKTSFSSSNHISLVTKTPQILVVDTKGKSLSLVAEIFGFLNFSENNIKGIILNRTSPKMYSMYKELIEENLNIKVYGYLKNLPVTFESRHLGLIMSSEIKDIKNKLDIISKECEKTIDIDGLIRLSENTEDFEFNNIPIENLLFSKKNKKIKIGVAFDKAFCFYYSDNFKLLEKMGAELLFFSPLNDKKLPIGISGLILGGGYPENNLEKLSGNKEMLGEIRNFKYPIYAECGGYMYLTKGIRDNQNNFYEMVGLIDTESFMTDKLVRFGYVRLKALRKNMLLDENEIINAHEFHYSDSNNNGDAFLAEKSNGITWNCIHSSNQIFAGYPHINFWGNINFCKNFILKCKEYIKNES